ncbi:TPA: hypothetical protein DDZ86_01835 [Candidatus Dependentiae bacterium]|nr:MAG: hypothetical protein UW09_C0001G0269 [candidate division TM6 bacterium GW2011_GWF2_43_87]HBL98365.1 hypothetical protein [Candidatus Dependentiae bacterium]
MSIIRIWKKKAICSTYFLVASVLATLCLLPHVAFAEDDEDCCIVCASTFNNDTNMKIAVHPTADNEASKHYICGACLMHQNNHGSYSLEECPSCKKPIENREQLYQNPVLVNVKEDAGTNPNACLICLKPLGLFRRGIALHPEALLDKDKHCVCVDCLTNIEKRGDNACSHCNNVVNLTARLRAAPFCLGCKYRRLIHKPLTQFTNYSYKNLLRPYTYNLLAGSICGVLADRLISRNRWVRFAASMGILITFPIMNCQLVTSRNPSLTVAYDAGVATYLSNAKIEQIGRSAARKIAPQISRLYNLVSRRSSSTRSTPFIPQTV